MKRKLIVLFIASFMCLLHGSGLSAAGKPSGGIKVICVGDSITAGYGVSISYPAHLANLLGSNYTVTNYGVSSTTLLKNGDFPYLSTREYANSLRSSPNIVIIQLGTNDAKPYNWQYKSSFVSDYKELINTYKNLASHPKVYVALSPTVFGSGNWGITNQVVTNEVVPLTIQAANETGSTIIDNNTLTANTPQNYADNIHPDNIGTAILANNVYASITSTTLAFNPAKYYKIVNAANGKAAAVSGASTADNALVVQTTYTGANDNQWQIVAVGGGNYLIGNRNSAKVMDVSGGSTADGAPVIQYTYGGSNNQKWQQTNAGSGSYKIVNVNSSKALDVPNGSTSDSTG